MAKTIAQMSQSEFDELFITLHSAIKRDPIKNFVEAPGFCNFVPTTGQRVLFKLAMAYPLNETIKYPILVENPDVAEGFELITIHLTESELYEFMTERTYTGEKRGKVKDISLILGRRAGKSVCSAILALYSCVKMNWKPFLGRKKNATILVMSHSKEFSDESIKELRAIIEESPILSRMIDKDSKNTQSTINLKVPFAGKKGIEYSYVTIRSNAASSRSSRGHACPVVLADEIAFWGAEADSKETDIEIVNAVKPTMMQFQNEAMWIALSSPNTKCGVLYEKYDKRFDLSDEFIVLKAPSWTFNDRYRIEDYASFYLENPDNFNREFRANFVDSMQGFFSPESIDTSVMWKVQFLPPEKGVKYYCAIDAAYKGDVFTVNVVGVRESKIRQYATLGFKGSNKKPVSSSEVATAIRKLNQSYDFNVVYADQYSFQPLRELFAMFNLTLEEKVFNIKYKIKIYKNVKYLLENKQLDLLDHPQTIREMKGIQVEISTTGAIKIHHPPGGKDDFIDSLAVACFAAIESSGKLESSFEFTDVVKDYQVPMSTAGVYFAAPPPEALSDILGSTITDTTDQYVKNPLTQRLQHISELEDYDSEEEGSFELV